MVLSYPKIIYYGTVSYLSIWEESFFCVLKFKILIITASIVGTDIRFPRTHKMPIIWVFRWKEPG